jgi:TPP-dependent indolepyruvate ferredoxin oxidoreductase alpha subunit
LNDCQHCIDSENCTSSSYLVRSVALSSCSYCFGCVGLVGKDFHILNERFERREYFALVEHLTRELGL